MPPYFLNTHGSLAKVIDFRSSHIPHSLTETDGPFPEPESWNQGRVDVEKKAWQRRRQADEHREWREADPTATPEV